MYERERTDKTFISGELRIEIESSIAETFKMEMCVRNLIC